MEKIISYEPPVRATGKTTLPWTNWKHLHMQRDRKRFIIAQSQTKSQGCLQSLKAQKHCHSLQLPSVTQPMRMFLIIIHTPSLHNCTIPGWGGEAPLNSCLQLSNDFRSGTPVSKFWQQIQMYSTHVKIVFPLTTSRTEKHCAAQVCCVHECMCSLKCACVQTRLHWLLLHLFLAREAGN